MRYAAHPRIIAASIALMLLPLIASAQAPVTLSPVEKRVFLGTSGLPLASGCVFTYIAGTTTNQATYVDSGGVTQNTNPVILDAAGRADIWLDTTKAYKFKIVSAGGVNCASGVTQWTVDNITALSASSILASNNVFTGNNTFSGTNTFSNPIVGSITGNAATASSTIGLVTVDGITYPHTNAGIQSAINATPAGGTVFLPAGTYVLSAVANEQFRITQAINFICAGWGTNLQLASTVGAIPVIHIVPSGSVGGIRIQDCNLQPQSGTPGSYAIQIDTSPGNSVGLFVIEHNRITGTFGTGGIWLNNTAGEVNGGFFDGHIEHNYIAGGILGTSIGDSLDIAENLIQDQGAKTTIGVDVSFTLGSSSLRIMNNTINPQGAAIHIGDAAIFTQISGNEFETPITATVGSNGAFVDIDGTVGNPADGVNVYRNSFQIVNSSTLNGLRINRAVGTNVRDNTFTLGTAPAKDIVITANAGVTRIRANNFHGATMANAISDSSGAGQTQMEIGGQGIPDIPVVSRDVSGAVNIYGNGSQTFGTGVAGANYLYDGNANNVALAASNTQSAIPAIGTVVSVASLSTRGVTNSTGIQLFNSTTTCTTGAAVGAICTTAAITLPVAYADTNYRLACTGQGPTNVPIVQTYAKSNTTFTITIAALTAAAATFTSYDCSAVHN